MSDQKDYRSHFDFTDAIRVVILAIIVAVIGGVSENFPALFGASGYNVVFYSISVILLLALFSHVTRRVIFPNIQLNDYVKKALDEPLASSVVFASIVYFLAVLVESGVALMK